MHLSQLFRQGIVMPLSDEAEMALRYEDVDRQTPVEFLKISDEIFLQLWFHGVIRAMRDHCGVPFNEYETDIIETDRVPDLKRAIAKPVNVSPEFMAALSSLIQKAVSLHRPLFFVL